MGKSYSQTYKDIFGEDLKIELNSVWRPTSEISGCGIVLRINQVPEHRYRMYSSDEEFDGKLYHFITDFGNVLVLTGKELLSNYDLITIEENPLERFERQRRLLKNIEEEYFIK